VLDLLLEYYAACHENLFLQNLIALVIGSPECVLIAHLKNFIGTNEPGPLNIHGSSDFAHATVAPWVVFDDFCFLRELEILKTNFYHEFF
jgi:hypothetical protein